MRGVIVTGSRGYIGSSYKRHMLRSGDRIVSIDKRENVADDHLRVDLSSSQAIGMLRSVTQGCTSCYHFAGIFIKNYAERSQVSWESFLVNNIVATRQIASFADQISARMVFASSLLVGSPFHGDDYYSRSKKRGEEDICKIKTLDYRICRLPRVIGLDELPAKAIPFEEPSLLGRLKSLLREEIIQFDIVSDFLRQALESDHTIRVENTDRERSYVHIRDCIKGLDAARDLGVGTYELCPYPSISLGSIGQLVAEQVKSLGISCRVEFARRGQKDVVGPTGLSTISIRRSFDSTEDLIRSVCREYMQVLERG